MVDDCRYVRLFLVLCHCFATVVEWEVYSNVHKEFNEKIPELKRQLVMEAERKKEKLDEIKAKKN